MEKIERVTVSEFAKMAGVSRKTIYKRLVTDLSPYCHQGDSGKVLDIKALELFGVTQGNTKVTERLQEGDSNLTAVLQGANSYNDTVVDVLKEQLNTMQKNLDILHEELKDKNEQIRGLTKALDQQQYLHRVEQQKVMALEIKKEDVAVEERPQELRPSELTPIKKTSKKRPKKGKSSLWFVKNSR